MALGVWRERDSAADAVLGSTLDAIVALARTWEIPVPVYVDTLRFGEGTGVVMRERIGAGEPRIKDLFRFACGPDGIGDSVLVKLDAGVREPLILDSLKVIARPTSPLGLVHDRDQWPQLRVGGAENERMVASVNIGGEERGSFGVRAGNDEVLDTHNIELNAESDEAVDVLRDRDEHLTSHMTALLGASSLIFAVNARGAALDKHFGELHVGGDTTVARVGVGNDGTQVVNIGKLGALSLGGAEAGLSLLTVVKLLGHEQVLDFVGDGIHGVIGEIRTGLVGG
ncbi:hypothetical protein BC937DRAFT_90251 [Endogone sp. FLAS-F59071]|nr:hypothetical protein BC937DRAFT_90251 [Endogone sp. FLAS-F59071]|eukprot:RUS17224.1 hypothetical protein BC937DRAFT_90251 [Endogone sp. FLAS-F59071]